MNNQIQVRVICYLPQHHENYVPVNDSEVDNNWPIVDVDLDELDQFNSECVDLGGERLRVIINVPLECCEFVAKVYGVIGENELLRVAYSQVTIISVSIPGMNTEFYDVDENNDTAKDAIIKLLGSR